MGSPGLYIYFFSSDGGGHCLPFHVRGEYCSGACTKKHRPMSRWTAEERTAQITHVEGNKASLMFAGGFARFLPDDKKHLLKQGESA